MILQRMIDLDPSKRKKLRNIDERLVSYNIEMAEITGETFWKAYLVINNSFSDEVQVMLPKDADVYMLTAEELRSSVMELNGVPLQYSDDHIFLSLRNTMNTVILLPASCTFLVV